MDSKKSFFELLEPKSALIVGLVTGFLTICTIGFIIMVGFNIFSGGNLKKVDLSKNNIDNNIENIEAITEVPKIKRPKVELFTMSYCPYGLQMVKAYIPVIELLKKDADLDIKFVAYAMHDKIEIDENTRQYCIQKEQDDKFIAYMRCFVNSDDSSSCFKESGVNTSKMNSCVAITDKEFGITKAYDDKSSWLSQRYPQYPLQADLNNEYGVQGSPTLIINGVVVENIARNPEAVKQAVCRGFVNMPEACSTELSTDIMQAGFGDKLGASTDASCG